jgi:putative membrane protein
MLFLIVLSVLLLAVVIFALQNAQAATVRFLFWQLQSSVALVTLSATAVGVLIAELFGLVSRWLRWKRAPARDGSATSGSAPL